MYSIHTHTHTHAQVSAVDLSPFRAGVERDTFKRGNGACSTNCLQSVSKTSSCNSYDFTVALKLWRGVDCQKMVTEDCVAKREREREREVGWLGGREGRLLSQGCSSVAVKHPNVSVYICLFRKKLNGFTLISSLSGAFAKLRKATVSCVISVCLSVRPLGTRLPLDGFV
jgi:hypothetical protein